MLLVAAAILKVVGSSVVDDDILTSVAVVALADVVAVVLEV